MLGCLSALLLFVTACGDSSEKPKATKKPSAKPTHHVSPKPTSKPTEQPSTKPATSPSPVASATTELPEVLPVVTNATSYEVMVNKQRSLPNGYVPKDLVEVKVPFSFSGKSDKKKLRKVAAEALEKLFAQADSEGIHFFGVSGYRSYGIQKAIFTYNVKTQGYAEARRYSAYPGTSEHQTGLSIDISAKSVGNQLEPKLGQTAEGKWLQAHCADFGFIIRYPNGKEAITGYAYEPWHIRYVGKKIAKEIMDQGLTLEEYFGDAAASTIK
jgi:D-alanyl-D-alanine carboxypeptidase